MPEVMGVRRSPLIVAEEVDELRTEGFVAEFVHSKSVYRFSAEAGLA